MASTNKGYALKNNNYASDLNIILQELLQQEQLVDVTLVADGHLFSVHRLVLSALSPYFRQMFTKMSVSQQAFVFLKDVSKETLEDLITFIYFGQVNVKQEHLDDFIKTAKALDIKGLADVGHANSPDVQSPVFNSFTPSNNTIQYKSTRTIPVPDQAQPNHDEFCQFEPPVNTVYQHHDNYQTENTNVNNGNGYGYDGGEYLWSDLGTDDSMAMDHDDQWYENSGFGAEVEPAKLKSNAKRTKTDIDTSEYNIVADIRTSDKGKENLFIAGEKFSRHNPVNVHGQQRWACSKKTKLNKCRASASTMEVNGTLMMKIIAAEHSVH